MPPFGRSSKLLEREFSSKQRLLLDLREKYDCAVPMSAEFDLPNVENAEEAAETAVRQFENLHLRHSLKMIADVIQVERVEDEHAKQQS